MLRRLCRIPASAVRPVAAARALSASAAASGGAGDEPLMRTPLYDLHVELGGKIVPFAGYELPVQYTAGVLKEHNHTRADGCASLFDVSHMGQLRWHGKDTIDFLETAVVADLKALAEGSATLSVLTNDAGGIVDDTVITKTADGGISMVINGATKFDDMKHLDAKLAEFRSANPDADVAYEYLDSRALVALQGPGAMAAVAPLVPSLDLSKMAFMTSAPAAVAGIEGCIVTRCGYTGEDGFEISVPEGDATALATRLLEPEACAPAGLGARDSLRLEAGLCLYGHDINETTTPIEAALAWTVAKSRRQDGRFPGADVIVGQLKNKDWPRRRIGLVVTGAPAREGARILSADGARVIGEVTSGTFSPTLKKAISMGYVEKGQHKSGTEVVVEVRGRQQAAVVSKMPFVPARYFRPE